MNVRLNTDLHPHVNSYGYQRVGLRRDGETHHRTVHQLVAQAFLTGWYPGVRIRFVDENPSNAHLENLRFHTARLGRLVTNNPKPKVRRVKVVETCEVFRTISDLARYLQADVSTIYKVLRGERPSHKGYTFEFVEEY